MGREIRRVPPNWEHPKDDEGDYRPLYEWSYTEKADEYISDVLKWMVGMHPDQIEYASARECKYYWEWNGPPPDPERYVKYKKSEATWYQMYENVSEGTPVTPPFATKEELITYLTEHGTFWDSTKWDRQNAEQFAEDGSAPTLITTSTLDILEHGGRKV